MIAGGVAATAAAEWLHGGAAGWAWVSGAAGLGAVGLAFGRKPRGLAPGLAAVASLVLGAVLVAGVLEVRRIECCWPAARERRVNRAYERLAETLERAKTEARRLAERAARAALLPREAAFASLARALAAGERETERGAAIFTADGEAWAWTGRHRVVPAPDTAELRATITPFYVVLEARRQAPDGGHAVGSVLLDASPAAADRAGAVSVAFARAQGVGLRFFAPGDGPAGPDVFDYATADGDTLFSVQPVPPSQGDAKLAALARSAALANAALAVALLCLLVAAPPGRWRWAVVLLGAWAVARAPLGPALELAALFSPATFYRPALGVFSASAASLTALGLVVLLAAGLVWRRGLQRRWWTLASAALLVLAAPYLLRHLGRGIAPPAGGVSFALWLSWQTALAAASMALVLLAAALVRGPEEPRRIPWTLPAACSWAALAGLAGLWLWTPSGAWPEWYTFVWLPALAGAIVPAPRRWALAGIATVAGTAAALVTWGAALEGRLALAERDARRLGAEGGGDAVAVALLERLGQQAIDVPGPRSASDLYALWLRSALAAEAYPSVLALWSSAGAPVAELRLAALDLPSPLLAALARSPERRAGVRVERLERIPGVHYALVTRLLSGDALTVGVGPRSRLVPPDRVARFLRGDVGVEPPYTISLSLPTSAPASASARVVWTRAGWSARGERRVELPGGVRHVHLRVDLRGPGALLVRGALVVLLDLTLLAAVWLFGRVVTDGWLPRPPPLLSALRTSYRARLTAALVAFFVTPVLALALWSFARLADEARRAGDLLVRQTLRDAAATAGAFAFDRSTALARSVGELGTRLDADLWVYRGGLLVGASAAILRELALVDPFLAPAAFQRLALEDELELTADGQTAGRPIRVGYRVVHAGPPREQAILAAPQLIDDESVRREQEDLALVLILATLAGLVAAVYLAGLAARTLAKPVAALREAALAVGRGAAPPAFPPGAPREFTPVISAFERMATDVRRSHEALEEARQRTALVLANVATGVIAVDEGLRVTMANPRAVELLGAALEPGDLLTGVAPGDWLPVWNAVAEFLAAGRDAIAEREFEIAGRQIRVQLAPLGPPPTPDGCVIALDDATELTHAARVLAWGEMARQVAHEIKNPLTPIRLGIQHLQRARGGGRRGDFDATLQETAGRILAEIDRLDAIARAFSRFGAPAAEQLPLEPVDVLAVAREVVQLYALGTGGGKEGPPRFDVVAEGAAGGGGPAFARQDEFKEVLVNLLENARSAGARRVLVRVAEGGRRVTVEDDGRGIPPEALPRVFEPTFSTTSSGSGLGLAIAKRLVESWGARIELASLVGRGTTVTIRLQERPQAGPPRGDS